MTAEHQRVRATDRAELLALLIAVLAAFSLTWNKIHVMSGDLALHYELAQRIADTWRWPLGDAACGQTSMPRSIRPWPIIWPRVSA